MKGAIIAILVLCAVFIGAVGCGSSNDSIVLECTSPLIQKGDGCCMDADKNGICDVDEKIAVKTAVKNESSTVKPAANLTAQKSEVAAAKEEIAEQEKPATTDAVDVGTPADAEKTAKLFAERWGLKQYNLMYPLFTDELKQKKTVTEFTTIMELEPLYKRLTRVEMTGVRIVDTNRAEIGLKAYTIIQEIDVPGATMEFSGGSWRINVFSDVFELPTFDAACSGYRNENKYQISDCAFDYAKKMKDPAVCNLTKCHYVECLKSLSQPTGMMKEAQQCYFCQPVGKTVNTCILDIAIRLDSSEPCNVIDDEHYSDKYCACYGGLAKAKNAAGYCSKIDNPDWRDACMKGYNGGYC
jgi:hypothetical protein